MKKVLLSALFLGAAMFAFAQEATVIFSDDFEWLAPWADNTVQSSKVSDTVGDNGNSPEGEDARQLLTNKVDGVNTLQALIDKGYDLVVAASNGQTPRDKGKQAYLQRNYLKFGLTNQRAGLQLPAIKSTEEHTNASIYFDWCPMRQGGGDFDKTELVVIVANGDDVKQFPVEPLNIENGAAFKWYNANVSLEGATVKEGTVITIRPNDEQWAPAETELTTIRYFLDNIQVLGATSGIEEIATENAPAEYFNLQGVRVANPENGLYIVRKGTKVSKVLVK